MFMDAFYFGISVCEHLLFFIKMREVTNFEDVFSKIGRGFLCAFVNIEVGV